MMIWIKEKIIRRDERIRIEVRAVKRKHIIIIIDSGHAMNKVCWFCFTDVLVALLLWLIDIQNSGFLLCFLHMHTYTCAHIFSLFHSRLENFGCLFVCLLLFKTAHHIHKHDWLVFFLSSFHYSITYYYLRMCVFIYGQWPHGISSFMCTDKIHGYMVNCVRILLSNKTEEFNYVDFVKNKCQ